MSEEKNWCQKIVKDYFVVKYKVLVLKGISAFLREFNMNYSTMEGGKRVKYNKKRG